MATMSEKNNELLFPVLIKHPDREELQLLSEAQIGRLPDPNIAEVFLDEKKAIERRMELSFGRITRAHRVKAAAAKTLAQRAKELERNPSAARAAHRREHDVLTEYVKGLPEKHPEIEKIKARLATLKV